LPSAPAVVGVAVSRLVPLVRGGRGAGRPLRAAYEELDGADLSRAASSACAKR